MEAPKDELYSTSIYVSWKIERKQNPIIKKISDKATNLVERGLEIKTKEPLFLKKMDPDIGNPCIAKFRSILEDFKFEDNQVKVNIRTPFGIENFAVEDRGDFIVGQHRLTFRILNKTVSDYGRVLPLILKKLLKIRVETDKVLLTVSDYRTPGQVKVNDSLWPKSGDTSF